MHLPSITCLTAFALSVSTSFSAEYVSTRSGMWDMGTPDLWQLSDTSGTTGFPLTGSTDSISILTGHTITYTGANNVGLTGTNDLGVANGQTISIDGGILTQSTNKYIRVGQGTTGTIRINDGRLHITDSDKVETSEMWVGSQGGTGIIHIGDGQGASQSAVLNLRDRVDGSANGGAKNMNLGSDASSGTGTGIIVIHSDGLLEGDVLSGSLNPVIRVGQSSNGSPAQSSITVLSGGLFRAHGTVEIGSRGNAVDRSNGLIHLDGGTMEMDLGELNVGWDGNGSALIENGGQYDRNLTGTTKYNIFVGRGTNGVGNITLQSGGTFKRGTNTQGEFYLGSNGTGNLTINDGGVFQNDSGNWDWVGRETTGRGTVTINEGGTYLTTGGASISAGYNLGSTGTILVSGGTLTQSAGGSVILGTNGTGTFRQTAGSTDVNTTTLGEANGSGVFELHDGIYISRGSFRMGGAATNSSGTGSGTALQSGGILTINGALSIGLASGHTGTFTMTGGTLNHTGSDLSVGESGAGKLVIGPDAVLDNSSTGWFFVGRNNGSSGELYVDGLLTRNFAETPISVGAGNKEGQVTDAPGILGGDGKIESTPGVHIGGLGTLTGGTLGTVGSLEIKGNLSVSAGGKLTVDLNSSGAGDRINLLGEIDLTGAVLGGTWSGDLPTLGQPFWLITNDDTDAIVGRFANISLEGSYQDLFPGAEGLVTFGGVEFAVYYHADFENNGFTGGNDLALKVVPEPSAAMLVGGAILLSLARRPRRRP